MKRFKFSLQPIHDLRQSAREEAERALAQAEAAVTQAAVIIEETVRLRISATEAYAAHLHSGALDPSEAALTVNYIASLVRAERNARQSMVNMEIERDQRRAFAIEAARRAEATAKLRERHQVRYTAEASTAEQNMLDEMATISVAHRHARNI